MEEKDIIRMSIKELKRLHVVKKVLERQLKQRQAASILSLSERQIRRIIKAVKEEGEAGIIHKSRGQPSNRRLPGNIKEEALKLYQDKYKGFGPTLATEKLEEIDKIKLSTETLRKWLTQAGLWKKTRKFKGHHKWRPRKEYFGEMVLIDGSHHDWLEGKGSELVLMGHIDDATGTTFAKFYDYEGTLPAMDSFKAYIKKYGIPLSIYLDRHTTYRSGRKLTIEEELQGVDKPLSQFERACKELGVEVIHANSPQARGRVERKFGVFQDRLIKEMRLAGISSKDEANDFLLSYLPKHNKRFSVLPAREEDLRHKVPKHIKLDQILAIKVKRRLRNDNTISFNGSLYLIEEKLNTKAISVEERTDGLMCLSSNGRRLRYKPIEKPTKKEEIKESLPGERKPNIPPPDHPWRQFKIKPVNYKKGFNQKEEDLLSLIPK